MRKKPIKENADIESASEADFINFASWYCTPKINRPEGIYTIKAYSEANNLAPRVLYEWMKTKRFTDYTQKYFQDYIAPRLTDIRNSLYEKAMAGDTQAIRLFFEFEQAWVKPDTKTEAEASSELASAIMEAIDKRRERKTEQKTD